jgi:hypothetical protein
MAMHKLIVAVVTLALSGLAFAAEPVAQPKTKAIAPTTAKPQVAKPAASKQVLAKTKPAAPKYYYVRATPLVAVPAAAAVATAVVPEVQTTAPEAGEVHTGRMVCEMGNSVTVTPDPQQPARFIVQMKKNTYHMTPVETSTGAVRLEDAQAGAMWLQLPNKSMLMNSKLGQRMADECQSDHQTVVAHRMKLDPPPSLLDHPTMAKK